MIRDEARVCILRFLASLLCICVIALAAPVALAQTDDQVVLVADTITETENSNVITATGNVEARYGGRFLRADRVVYDRRTGRVRATGNVSITGEDGTQQFANEIEVNETLDDGYAVGFSTRLPERGVAIANSAVRQPNGINALDQAIYTACEVCEEKGIRPTWALRARRAVLNENNDIISYRDAVLEIGGIPVVYLPYFFHPDPTAGRRSGLLAPRVGGSGRLGFLYGQPYYKVLSPSSDLTITPTLYTRVRPLLEAQYRKRFWSGSLNLEGSITYEQDFDNNGVGFGDEQIRGHIFGNGEFQINDVFKWGFGLERASDDLFTRRYSIDGENAIRGLYDGQPRTLLSQLYTTAQTESFYGEVSALVFQDLQASNPNLTEAPLTTPLVYSEKLFNLGSYGRAGLTATSAILSRDRNNGVTPSINPDSRRVSIGGNWELTRVLPGGIVVEPFADARVDYYDLDELASGQSDVTRVLGSVGGKVSWPLARTGKNASILIEPTVLGAWGLSNTNDPVIPNEDSQLFELDESRLFESNGFGNFDLYEGDGRLAVGLSGQVNFKGGPKISGIAGRRWRSRSDDAFDVASNLDGTSSDWVGSLAVDFGRNLRVDTRVRLDDADFSLNRLDTRIRTSFSIFSASARYFRVDEDIRTNINSADEGIDFNARINLTKNYSVSYGQLTDLNASTDLRRTFGIAYQDDCSRFELVYTRSGFNDRTLGANDQILFRFTLATIGEFGGS